jgi:DNA-binding NarL/FixJ family response regulator
MPFGWSPETLRTCSPYIITNFRILILTVYEDDTSIFPAIRAGARGYLLKNREQEDLVRAVNKVANGEAIFSPGIAQKVLGYLLTPPPQIPASIFDELTERERIILEQFALGKTNAEIAAFLSLSPKTISNYISKVLLKVHITDRAKLMLIALEAGMGR